MSDTVKIKNVSGEDLLVPWLGGRLVAKGQVVEVPADQAWGFTQQAETWAPQDAAARKAHSEASSAAEQARAEKARLLEERFGAPQPPSPAPPPDTSAPASAGDDTQED